ncbi:Cyanovirin-N [Trichoderma velutinum]
MKTISLLTIFLYSFAAAAPLETLAADGLLLRDRVALERRNYFASSCTEWGLNTYYPSILNGECWNTQGQLIHNVFDLDGCIANYGGQLTYAKNGGYGFSCDKRNCAIVDSTWLQCNCKGYSGQTVFSKINLNDILTNDNGNLRC